MNPQDIERLTSQRLEQAHIALDDAKFLLDGGRSSQSVVNRSYYAMFYAALALLQSISKAPSKHTGVISLFDTEFAAKGVFSKDLSKDLHRAFELRQTADYRTMALITPEMALETWQRAARFVEAIHRYFEERRKQTTT